MVFGFKIKLWFLTPSFTYYIIFFSSAFRNRSIWNIGHLEHEYLPFSHHILELTLLDLEIALESFHLLENGAALFFTCLHDRVGGHVPGCAHGLDFNHNR